MANFTLLKLNLEGATFNAPGAGTTAGTDAPAPDRNLEAPPGDEPSNGPGKGAAVGALVGLGFLVVVALVAKRRLGSGTDELEDDTGTTVTLDAN